MNALSGIGVKVVGGAGPAQTVGSVRAIAHEIETLLGRLIHNGEPGAIDLRSLPMSPEDYAGLRALLGEGEVSAVIDAFGPTEVRETAVRGVWWVSHRNSEDDTLAELIEVTHVPEILKAHPDDVEDGLELLRARLAEHAQT